MRVNIFVFFFLYFSFRCVYATTPAAYQNQNGLDILPTIKIGTGSNSNITSSNQSISSPFISISPKLIGFLKTTQGIYQASYQFDATHYTKSNSDDIFDQQFQTGAFFLFNYQQRLQLNYQYNISHDPRGSGLTEGIGFAINHPLRYQQHAINSRYTYGSIGAPGRISTSLGYENKEYDNILFFRDNQAIEAHYYNWQQPYLSSEFYYSLSSHFHALAIMRFEDRNYQYIDPSLNYSKDSVNSYFYNGLEWNITGKTQGKLLVGLQDKNFSDNQRKDVKSFSWRANIKWSMTDYSQFRLDGFQHLHDSQAQGDYAKSNILQLDWEHQWNNRLSTLTSAAMGSSHYPDNSRHDKNKQLSFTLIYNLQRWLDLTLNTTHYHRDSSLSNFSYQQMLFLINMEMSL